MSHVCEICGDVFEESEVNVINNHVIPRSLLASLRDDVMGGKIIGIKNIYGDKIGPTKVGDYFYGPYAYCKNCESFFGSLEDYVVPILKKAASENFIQTDWKFYLIVNNVDVEKIKKFFLSILLRIGSSKKFFTSFDLGKMKEKIRRAVFSPDNQFKEIIFSIVCVETPFVVDNNGIRMQSKKDGKKILGSAYVLPIPNFVCLYGISGEWLNLPIFREMNSFDVTGSFKLFKVKDEENLIKSIVPSEYIEHALQHNFFVK